MTTTSIYQELGIEVNLAEWFADPNEYARIVARKAMELSSQLESAAHTSSGRETIWKKAAEKNTEAKAKADEITEALMSVLSDESGEVLYHVQMNLKHILTSVGDMVRTEASHAVPDGLQDRVIIHQQYVALRKAYYAFLSFMDISPKTVPVIPPKSGNYAPKSGLTSIYIYKVTLGGIVDIHQSPYFAIRKSCQFHGWEIPNNKNREDCHDWIAAHPDCCIEVMLSKD